MKHLIIIGAGGMGRQIHFDATCSKGYGTEWDIKGFIDDNLNALSGIEYQGYPPVIGTIKDYQPDIDDVFTCSIGNVITKHKVCDLIESKGGEFINLIHKNVYLHPSVRIGKGVIISYDAGFGVDVTIGDFCLIQSGAIIGHDVRIGNYSRIDCRVILVGGVIIGNDVTVHTNSIISHNVVVDDGAKVGAMSFVIRKVKSGTTVQGNPAKRIIYE